MCGFLIWNLLGCTSVDPERVTVSTNRAPDTAGFGSQALLAENTLYVSGQIGVDSQRGQLVPGGILSETRQVIQNIGEILRAADFSASDVVRLEIYLTNINDFETIQSLLHEFFEEPYPAVQLAEVARLPRGAQISIMAIAVKR